jgi:cysteinyl-tRNA synthetase
VKLYNTLTRRVENFTPLDPQGKKVALYVCGPTVYDVPHLGHLRSAYVFDVLRCVLSRKYDVTFVRNVTDVDDKIIERARQEKNAADLAAACRTVSSTYLAAYHQALSPLGIQSPSVEPKATEHVVPEMTDFIAKLLIQGVAYEAKGDVYFSVKKHAGYGALSNRTLDDLQAGTRVEPGEHKQDPMDFALWKAAKPGEPSWSSPWGPGRPGWHIECSAMSIKYLGSSFDIHGGGLDLIFPHHENEIAQSQAAGHAFARFWVHHGLLTVNGEKMSKSLGNYVTLDRAIADGGSADAVKLFFLKTHYRSPADYSAAKLAEAKRNIEELSRVEQHSSQAAVKPDARGSAGRAAPAGREAFYEALEDDLNTPKALAIIFDWVNECQRLLDSGDGERAQHVQDCLQECLALLGLSFGEQEFAVGADIQKLIDARNAARKAKDFAKADAIRKSLEQRGILLADTSGGTRWERKR